MPPAGPLARPAAIREGRLGSIDALRGIAMILMALDHVRDFVHAAAMSFSPTDLGRTSALIFVTRWVTHFCAPTFAFTAGIGAFLWARRGRTTFELSGFLLSRGLWLMLLEVTLLRFLLFFDAQFQGGGFILTILWVLGLSMMALAALVHLGNRALLLLSLVTIAFHNALDGLSARSFGRFDWAFDLLHRPGAFQIGSATLRVAYPLIPWVAVMAAGYCLGPVFAWEPERRQRLLLSLGVAVTGAFLVLRAANVYGDPRPWSHQDSPVFTLLSFLNCTKYPPSLAFLLMTLGPALALMAVLERLSLTPGNALVVFGRVPLFFFILHMGLAHLIALGLGFLRYGAQHFLVIPAPSMGGSPDDFPQGYGYDLGVVYLAWIAVVAILYPACRWFARVKAEKRSPWLSYL